MELLIFVACLGSLSMLSVLFAFYLGIVYTIVTAVILVGQFESGQVISILSDFPEHGAQLSHWCWCCVKLSCPFEYPKFLQISVARFASTFIVHIGFHDVSSFFLSSTYP